jgi:hypothetical protein
MTKRAKGSELIMNFGRMLNWQKKNYLCIKTEEGYEKVFVQWVNGCFGYGFMRWVHGENGEKAG